jgi:hypothetical protein
VHSETDPTITSELLDQLLASSRTRRTSRERALKEALIERAVGGFS